MDSYEGGTTQTIWESNDFEIVAFRTGEKDEILYILKNSNVWEICNLCPSQTC